LHESSDEYVNNKSFIDSQVLYGSLNLTLDQVVSGIWHFRNFHVLFLKFLNGY
jgi:hypothetical protein